MATTSQWWSGQISGLVNSAVRYIPVNGNQTTPATTEAQGPAVVSSAGNVLSIAVKLSGAPGAGTSYRFQLSVNSVASTVIDLTISDTNTVGLDVGVVALAAGDLVTIAVTPTGTPTSVNAEYWIEFDPTTANAYCYPAGYPLSLCTSASTWYGPLFGNHVPATSQSFLTRALSPFAGTITAFRASIQTAPGAGTSWAVTIIRNGTPEATSVITIANAATTGSVTGLTIAVSAADYLEVSLAPTGAVTSTRGVTFCATFAPTTTGLFALYGNTTTSPNAASVTYGTLGARRSVLFDATETNVSVRAPAALAIKATAAMLLVAPGAGKSRAFTFRNDPAGGGSPVSKTNTVTISDANTSATDSAHTDTIAAGDLIDVITTPTGSPAVSAGVLWAVGAQTIAAGSGSTGGKGKGGKKGGGTGTPNPPGKLKTFGVNKWRWSQGGWWNNR